MENTAEKLKTHPKDFFLNLGAIILLYTGIINILNLLFSLVDKIFPDTSLVYYSYANDSVRWAIASLIIIFPLYILITNYLEKDILRNPEKKEINVRKWLVYLTLFLSGSTISIDMIVLLNAFLAGELTERFILKVLFVLIVLGTTFGYYLLNLRENRTYNKKFFWMASLLIISSIVGGFYVMGSPAKQRMMRIDESRISDLQNIQWQIVNYWQQKEKIPNSLIDLNDSISGFITPVDPETREQYNYEIIDQTNFKLCANFNLDSEETLSIDYPKGVNYGESWFHKKGKFCFERKIDVDLYPPKINQRLID